MIIGISGKIKTGKDLVGNIIRYLNQLKNTNQTHSWENWIDWTYQDDLEYENDWEIKKWADKLKDIVCLLINCTREELEDRNFKEKELGKEWWRYCIYDNNDILIDIKSSYEEIVDIYGEDGGFYVYKLIKTTPRLLLQLIGTDCFRNIIHSNTWVNSLMSEYKKSTLWNGHSIGLATEHPDYLSKKYPNWLITDTRFPNEADAIKDKKGLVIRVNRNLYHYEDSIVSWSKLQNLMEADTGQVCTKEYANNHWKVQNNHESETALDHYENWDYVIDNNGTIEDLIIKVKEILIKEKII